MALKDLKLEAEAMEKMFNRANDKKPGGLRYELARDSQQHTIDAKELARQLSMHTERPFKGRRHYGKKSPEVEMTSATEGFVGGDKNKVIKFNADGVITTGEKGRNAQTPEYRKWVDKYGEDYKEAIFANFKPTLEDFCTDYVKTVRKAIRTDQYASEEPGSTNQKVIFTIFAHTVQVDKNKWALADVYNKVQEFCKAAATETVESKEKYIKLFAKSSSSISQLTNIGHTIAVAEEKAGILAKSSQKAADSKVINSSKLKVLNAQIQQALKDLELSIDFTTVRDVDFINKTLTDNRTVLSDAESHFFNQARSGNPEAAGLAGISETQIGNKVAELLRKFKAELTKEYEKAAGDKKGSQTMLEAAKAMILYSAIEKVDKKTIKVKSKLTKPKTGKKKRKVPVTKVKFKRGHKIMKPNTIGLGGAKPAQEIPSMPPRMNSESGTSLAPLIAILNSKLPETVARNMGPPGLENQTGRFASSVRVTDVSRTAQGHPSVGYGYQKNPYQVFETGQGRAPWATPDRDPRKLIDKSIREIAAQFAIGRFYTRRI